jgi:hypothetical protein
MVLEHLVILSRKDSVEKNYKMLTGNNCAAFSANITLVFIYYHLPGNKLLL